jgi:diadenosine tetraphosphatase ApaH/serine/threonine PP2A family protein phosphatase
VKLLPSTHDVAHSTAKPEYRNWVPDEEFSIANGELSKASSEIVRRLLEDVGTDGLRWRTLIKFLDQLPKTEFDAIIDHLNAMDLKALSQPNRLQIWEALRVLLSHHLQFSHAEWALPQPAIERLQECYNRFEPEDPILKKRWLFSRHCDFPEAGHTRGRERENEINKARVDVAEELFGLGGLPMVLELIHQSEDPYLAVWALG